MKVHFLYDEEKDIDCLLSKGPGSHNQPNSKTKTFEALVSEVSDLNNREEVREFVRNFLARNQINLKKNIDSVQHNWNQIHSEFEKRAEKVFGVKLNETVSVYLTVTGRYPYSFDDTYFYVSATRDNVNKTVMHELWHFYTLEKFGKDLDNDSKEALTVLLNVECSDLLAGELDVGYPQHQGLREKILELWTGRPDINNVWNEVTQNKT